MIIMTVNDNDDDDDDDDDVIMMRRRWFLTFAFSCTLRQRCEAVPTFDTFDCKVNSKIESSSSQSAQSKSALAFSPWPAPDT